MSQPPEPQTGSAPSADWQSSIEAIHRAPVQCVLAVTGGGATAISELLSVPGGSRTVLEAIVPYASRSLAEWLGRLPEQFCGPETALAMASVACQRASRLARPDDGTGPAPQCLGIACTASLASDRPKRGAHRAFMAAHHNQATRLWWVEFQKGARSRRDEERVTGLLLLSLLAESAGVAGTPAVELLMTEPLHRQTAHASPAEHLLATGRQALAWSLPDGRLVASLQEAGEPNFPAPRGILPGAFNPLHQGHAALRDAAERALGGPVYYELSLHNVDKPPLEFLTIAQRRAQFQTQPLALTCAPTFERKALLFPGAVFVVGVDTAERIVHPRYYHGDSSAMLAALEQIGRQGCRFLVAGRKQHDRYRTLAEIAVPEPYRHLFEALPEAAFRADISSTQLRQRAMSSESPGGQQA